MSPDTLSTAELVHALIERFDRYDDAFSVALAALLAASLDGYVPDPHLQYRPARVDPQ